MDLSDVGILIEAISLDGVAIDDIESYQVSEEIVLLMLKNAKLQFDNKSFQVGASGESTINVCGPNQDWHNNDEGPLIITYTAEGQSGRELDCGQYRCFSQVHTGEGQKQAVTEYKLKKTGGQTEFKSVSGS